MPRSRSRKSAERSTTRTPRSRSAATAGAATRCGQQTSAASTSPCTSGSHGSSSSGTRVRGWTSSSRSPASDRAVTCASSKDGWRCTSIAAIAPAYPLAPSTATLGTQLAPDLVAQRGDDLLAPLGDLLVGERAVGGAELQPDGERRAALADLRAAVDVEHLGAAQERAAGAPDHLQHARGRHAVADDDREVLPDRRERREVLVARHELRRAGERAEVQLESCRG